MAKKNVFQQLEDDQKIPPKVKQELMSNLESTKLVGELIDLFMIKSATAIAQVLSPGYVPKEEEGP